MLKAASERASERGSERTQLHGANTTSSTNRSNKTKKHNCWVRTPKAAKTETTKQKQHTQQRIFISCHPLPFRSIALCIGVRTAILHRCSHLVSIPPSCIGVRTVHVTIAARSLLVCHSACSKVPAPWRREPTLHDGCQSLNGSKDRKTSTQSWS